MFENYNALPRTHSQKIRGTRKRKTCLADIHERRI